MTDSVIIGKHKLFRRIFVWTSIITQSGKKYGFGEGYIYTHAAPDIEQQFMPDELVGVKYLED